MKNSADPDQQFSEAGLDILIFVGIFIKFLFDLILYAPSTIFQLYRDVSSWVEPVLS